MENSCHSGRVCKSLWRFLSRSFAAYLRDIPGTLFKWELRDREPLHRYSKGRVTMLGDAAHRITTFLGQGACIAIEDALVLGRAFIASKTVSDAFAIYEGTRKERGNGVQLASRQQADEIQGVTKRGANPGANADDRGLYVYNPVTVPLVSPW
jgi:salicylate hydroxylase